MLSQVPSGAVTAVSFAHPRNVFGKCVGLGKVTYGGAVPVAAAQRVWLGTQGCLVFLQRAASVLSPSLCRAVERLQEGGRRVHLGCGRGQ